MQLGMIGSKNGRQHGSPPDAWRTSVCTVFDLNPDNVKHLTADGATGAGSMEEFVQKMAAKPRAAWVMVPSGEATEKPR